MPNIQNKNFKLYTDNQKKVLDLEKKYFNLLFKIFSQQSFSNEMRAIMNDINKNWNRVHTIWGKENVVDLAVERHINFRIYNDPLIRKSITSVYPSVISSDTAFVTNDAVINIDSKTNNVSGNATDWTRQTIGCNQHSFDNKLNFYAQNKKVYVPVTNLLKPYHKSKPVLSFFLSTLYYSDKKNKIDSWYVDSKYKIKPYYDRNPKKKDKSIVRPEFLFNIKLSCMPHMEVSSLFDNNIIDGTKSYIPPDDPNPIGTDAMRVTHDNLKERYDSNGRPWDGFKCWSI